MCKKIIQALTDLKLVIGASSKNVLTLEETHTLFGSGWSDSELRKYMVIPNKAKHQKPEKEGLEYGKHYVHNGARFYIIKNEFEKFLICGDN